MKVQKAIEILDLNVKEVGPKMPPDTLDALKLGIEALERIDGLRSAGHYIAMPLLKGETEE